MLLDIARELPGEEAIQRMKAAWPSDESAEAKPSGADAVCLLAYSA